MRLLVVGSDSIDALENFYVRNLRLSGIEVSVFPAHSIFYDYYKKSLTNKILYKAGFSPVYKQINKELLNIISRDRPDLVIIFKGMEIFPLTLRQIKGMGIRLVNINPDNPFIFTGPGSGNQNVTDSIPLYDLHITYSISILRQLREMGLRAERIPFGFELSNEMYENAINQTEISRLCFLGNPDKERAGQISEIASRFPVDVFGNNWKRYLQHPNVNIQGPAFRQDFWKVLRRYRIQLNLLRVHNLDAHSMRTFEINGVGGIQLAPDTEEHRSFFQDGVEIFLYKDLSQRLDLIGELLEMSAESAMKVREAARNRSLESGYTYSNRTKELLQYL